MKLHKLAVVYLKKVSKQMTLLDYLIISSMLIAAGIFVIFFRRENTYLNIQIKITDNDVQYMNVHPLNEYAQNIVVGDAELNELGQTTAKITNITSYRIEPDKQVVYLTINTKANYNPRKKQYSVKGMPIVAGQPIAFTLTKLKFTGIITDFSDFNSPTAKSPIKLTAHAQLMNDSNNRQFSDTYGVLPHIAAAVKTGDEVKDLQGNVLVKVKSVDIRPAKRTIVTQRNESLTIYDQELKDVFYTLEINAYKKNNAYFIYDYVPVSIGQVLPLSFPTVTVQPTITDFE